VTPRFQAALHDTAVLTGFQALLRRCPTAADRKRFILAGWETRALTRDETRLLVEAHQLETA
jgi:hypothetical protein